MSDSVRPSYFVSRLTWQTLEASLVGRGRLERGAGGGGGGSGGGGGGDAALGHSNEAPSAVCRGKARLPCPPSLRRGLRETVVRRDAVRRGQDVHECGAPPEPCAVSGLPADRRRLAVDHPQLAVDRRQLAGNRWCTTDFAGGEGGLAP